MWITTESLLANINVYFAAFRLPDRNWNLQLDPMPYFIWCATINRRVGPMPVVPGLKVVESLLQRSNADWQDGQPEPDSQGLEQAFDLAIERWLSNLAFHNSDVFQLRYEPFFELASVVGDDESRLAV